MTDKLDEFFDDDDVKTDVEDAREKDPRTAEIEKKVHKFSNISIPFGKFKWSSLLEVAESDPRYLSWMSGAYRSGRFRDNLMMSEWIENNIEYFDDAVSVAAQRLVLEAPELTLTEHQKDVVTQVLHFVRNDRLNIVRMQGGSGYGKSFATEGLARELILDGYIVSAMAVSYVATEVLHSQLRHLGVSCGTVARTLKFNKRWSEGTEVYEFSEDTTQAAGDALGKGRALIVDECSMIPDETAQLLFNVVNASGGLLILVGDDAQLPPVKQERKSVCCDPWPVGVATLVEPMRYDRESDLFSIEQNVRTNPWGVSDLLREAAGSKEVTVVESMEQMVDVYARLYREDPRAIHRMLLFRRTDVTWANASIRQKLFADDKNTTIPDIVDDEQLMILSTSDYPFFQEKTERSRATRYYSGESFQVVSFDKDEYVIGIGGNSFKIPCYNLQFDGRPNSARIIFAVSDTHVDLDKHGGPEYQTAMTAAGAYAKETKEQKALGNIDKYTDEWLPYKRLKGDFVQVAYQYATSVHRAQGQTCDYAYCAPESLLAAGGLMGSALTYVAMTRARKHLTVLI